MNKIVMTMIVLLLLGFWLNAQKGVNLNGMTFNYEILEDSHIEISLEAPTKGWVGVGFNDHNDIVGSDLYLFHVVGQEAEALDMKVVGLGNPKIDSQLGGTHSVAVLKGQEVDGRTKVTFRLPFPSSDPYDFRHELGKQFWLILAYSTHDEFDHHSRMRKHIPFTLEHTN